MKQHWSGVKMIKMQTLLINPQYINQMMNNKAHGDALLWEIKDWKGIGVCVIEDIENRYVVWKIKKLLLCHWINGACMLSGPCLINRNVCTYRFVGGFSLYCIARSNKPSLLFFFIYCLLKMWFLIHCQCKHSLRPNLGMTFHLKLSH